MWNDELVTAAWGIVGFFGVAIALLMPRADDEYKEFLRDPRSATRARARRWSIVTRRAPWVVAGIVTALFLVAAIWRDDNEELTATSIAIVLATMGVQVAFAVMVQAIVRPVPASLAPAVTERCGDERRPPHRGEPTGIEFVNQRRDPVGLHWMDHDGSRQARARLERDDCVGCSAYAGELFLVEDERSGECVSIFVASEQPTRAVINDDSRTRRLPDSTPRGSDADSNRRRRRARLPRAPR